MIQNINFYGLSHLCAFSIFEPTSGLAEEFIGDAASSYPYLDIYIKNDRTEFKRHVEFYSRGNKYYKTSFNNLFEYLILNEQSGYKD